MNSNRRKLKSLLINPKAQIRYGMMFMAVSIIVHAVATVVVVTSYAAWLEGDLEGYPMSVPAMAAVLFVVYLLLYGFSFVLGLLVSHRLYGPLVSFERHFENLKQGQYSSRISLRTEDDPKLKLLADHINEMTARLQK